MSEESSIADRPETNACVPSDDRKWKQRTSRNLAVLALARGVATVLTLFLTAYLTRALEPSAYGILGFGTALLSYFLLLTRLGFDVVGIRDVARAPQRAAELAGVITSVQLLLSIAAYVLYAVIVMLLPKGGFFKLVLLIQGLALFAQAISMEWIYQGVERMGVLAVRIVAIAALHLGAVLVIVHTPDDLALAAAAQVGALLLLNAWLLVTFVRDFGGLRLRIDLSAWRAMMPSTLSIAASTFMVSIFYNVDQVMLGLFRSEAEVGLYTVSVRALTAVFIPAVVIAQAFFPALSNARGDPEVMRERARGFAATMIPVGIPLATAVALLARPLIVLLAGEAYAPAATTLSLLMANAGLVYVNMTFGRPLIAWNREKAYMAIVGTGALLDVVLNFFLIPRYGIVGAASTTVTAQVVLFVGLAFVHIRMVHQTYLSILIRTMLATSVGVVLPVLFATRAGIPLLPTLLLAGCAYGIAAWALRLVNVGRIRSLFSRT